MGSRRVNMDSIRDAATSFILAYGPITIPAGGSYTTPVVATNGFHYAQMVPASVSGSGTLAIGGTRQRLKGVLTWIHNSGWNAPPGMTEEGGALGWGPPINDGIYGTWDNSSTTASLTLGDIYCNLSV